MNKVILIDDCGGYNEYGVDITKHMKNIFPALKNAYGCFMAEQEDLIDITSYYETHDYFKDKFIQENQFLIDGTAILLEFDNGRKVRISVSETGWIQVVN